MALPLGPSLGPLLCGSGLDRISLISAAPALPTVLRDELDAGSGECLLNSLQRANLRGALIRFKSMESFRRDLRI